MEGGWPVAPQGGGGRGHTGGRNRATPAALIAVPPPGDEASPASLPSAWPRTPAGRLSAPPPCSPSIPPVSSAWPRAGLDLISSSALSLNSSSPGKPSQLSARLPSRPQPTGFTGRMGPRPGPGHLLSRERARGKEVTGDGRERTANANPWVGLLSWEGGRGGEREPRHGVVLGRLAPSLASKLMHGSPSHPVPSC